MLGFLHNFGMRKVEMIVRAAALKLEVVELNQMRGMKYLYLGVMRHLSGTLPSQLADLTSLGVVQAFLTSVSGTMPTQLTTMRPKYPQLRATLPALQFCPSILLSHCEREQGLFGL